MAIPLDEIFGDISFPWWPILLLMVFLGSSGLVYVFYQMVWYYLPSVWRIVILPKEGFVYQITSGRAAFGEDGGEGRHKYWLLCYAGWHFDKKTGDIVLGEDENFGGILGKGIYLIGFFETVAKIHQRWAEVKDGKYILRDAFNRGLLVKKAIMGYMVDVMDEDNFPFKFLGNVILRMCNPDKASRFTHEARQIVIGFIASEWLSWSKDRKIYRPSVEITRSEEDQVFDINVKINPDERDSDQLLKEFWAALMGTTYEYRPFIVTGVATAPEEPWPINWLTSRLPYYKGIFFEYEEAEKEKSGSFLDMVKEVYGFEIERMTLDSVVLDEEFAKVISAAIRAKMEGAADLIAAYFDKEAKLQSQEPAKKMGKIFDESPGAAYWELVNALANNMPASLLDLSVVNSLVRGAAPNVSDEVAERLIKDVEMARKNVPRLPKV